MSAAHRSLIPKHRTRLLAGCLAALVLLGACASSSGAERQVNPPVNESALGFTPVAPKWERCADGSRLQCASLEVPLDYDDPTGPTIDLALAMYPARGPEARIGVLITNPGGPGNSGIDFLGGGGPFNDEINRRFDVVSWDPRGVGRTEPLACGDRISTLFLDVDLAPVDDDGRVTLEREARDAAVACGEANGAFLQHAGTANAVKDVEAIRLALGGEPLTYVGFSYGTLIGLHYADRFPASLRAMAIDGIVDPGQTLGESLTTIAVGIDRSLAEVLRACVTNCPIEGDPITAYRELVEQVREQPLKADNGGDIAGNAVVLAGMAVTYDDTMRDLFYSAVAEGQRGLGNIVQQFAEGFVGQFDLASTVNVYCVDRPHPTTITEVEDLATEAAHHASVVPGLVSGYIRAFALPCVDWKTTSATPEPVTAEGSPPILVIGNTGDNATPYDTAVRVAGSLTNGRLMTYHGTGHTTYAKDECADSYIDAYVLDLAVPPSGAGCPG